MLSKRIQNWIKFWEAEREDTKDLVIYPPLFPDILIWFLKGVNWILANL